MKKLATGNLVFALAAICTLAATVIYYVNASGSYYHDFNTTTLAIGILCLAAEIIGLILIRRTGEQQWTDLVYPVCTCLLGYEAIRYLGARVESAGIILGSELEDGNAAASAALNLSFTGIGLFVAAMLLVGIAGFFRQTRDA